MIANQSLQDYLSQLAARASTPGGGAAAGVSGAQGAALLAMVARFTRNNADQMQRLADQCDAVVARMLSLSDDDAAGFTSVMAAYAIKAGTDDEKTNKHMAVQQSLRAAAAAPLGMFEAAMELIPISKLLLTDGNKNLITDVGIGAMELSSCLVACRMNLLINLRSIDDAEFNQDCQRRLLELQTGLDELSEVILQVEQGLKTG